MSIRLVFAALMALPFVAAVQPAASQEVRVRIVGTGQYEAPASSIVVTGTFWKDGESQAEADAALAANYDALARAVAKLGLPASALVREPRPTALLPTTSILTVPTVKAPPPPPPPPASSSGARLAPPIVTTPRITMPPPPVRRPNATGGYTVTLANADQLAELRRLLAASTISLGTEQYKLADEAAARRQAKTRAVTAARADADAYAASLGLKAVRLVLIDEAGQLTPPTLARMLEASAPPYRLRTEPAKPGFVRVEASVMAEFALTP